MLHTLMIVALALVGTTGLFVLMTLLAHRPKSTPGLFTTDFVETTYKPASLRNFGIPPVILTPPGNGEWSYIKTIAPRKPKRRIRHGSDWAVVKRGKR